MILLIDNLPVDGTISVDVFCNHVTSRHHDSPLHVHSHHIELFLLISGNVSFYTEKQAFKMQPKSLIIIPDGIWHCAVTHDGSPYERAYVNIDLDLINILMTDKTNLYKCFEESRAQEVSTIILDEQQCASFTAMCETLSTVIEQNKYASDIYERIILLQMLLLANEVAPMQEHQKNNIPKLLERLTRFISENMNQDLSLSMLGQRFFLNPNYINQYFKKYMHVSIHTYVIKKRIELSKQLLREGASVTDTCERCGFGNYSSFIRTFGRYVGMSPGKYRKMYYHEMEIS